MLTFDERVVLHRVKGYRLAKPTRVFCSELLERGLLKVVCPCTLISQKVFITSLCKSQFPHKSVNLFFILVIVKDRLTDLSGN